MIYIKLFDLTSDYINYIQSEDALLPNVSLVQEITKMFYNPIVGDIDYTQQYLTFEAVTSGKFGFIKSSQSSNVQYSLDNGSTWVNMDFTTDVTKLGNLSESDLAWTPIVEAGQKIIWKGIYTYVEESDVPGIGLFYSTGDYNISGNILSMVAGDNFTTVDIDDVNTTYLLYATFGLVNYQVLHKNATQGTFNTIPGPVDCSNLVLLPKHNGFEYYMTFQCCGKMTAAPKLPVTELVAGDYMFMFAGCESLTTAPVLPATILTPDCYHGMFSACKNLNNVTMLATDISAERCLIQMLPEVSATGTFTKAPGVEIPTATDDNNYTGIPAGWTVVDYVA